MWSDLKIEPISPFFNAKQAFATIYAPIQLKLYPFIHFEIMPGSEIDAELAETQFISINARNEHTRAPTHSPVLARKTRFSL